MQLLFSSLNLHEVHHLKNLLETEGIRCHIKNELLSRLAGEIPFTECAPQLWLLDERDLERAKRRFSRLMLPSEQKNTKQDGSISIS